MTKSELEDTVKKQMHYHTNAPSCRSCKCFDSGGNDQGPLCTANIAVQFFTLPDAWCSFHKSKDVAKGT